MSLDSIELVNQILPHIKHLPNDFVDNNPLVIANEEDIGKLSDKKWSSITVKEHLFEDMRNELSISDFPHVQFIHIQCDSLRNISSLTISNLPSLSILVFETGSSMKTTSLSLSGILYWMS